MATSPVVTFSETKRPQPSTIKKEIERGKFMLKWHSTELLVPLEKIV
jgi:hypothetical protein